MLIVAPGSFRTEGVHAYPATINTRIPAYEAARTAGMARFEGIAGKERGDPAKAMEILVDVVRGEGVAQGRPWPLYLPLGRDAEAAIRDKCAKICEVLDEWKDVIRSTDLDEDKK